MKKWTPQIASVVIMIQINLLRRNSNLQHLKIFLGPLLVNVANDSRMYSFETSTFWSQHQGSKVFECYLRTESDS